MVEEGEDQEDQECDSWMGGWGNMDNMWLTSIHGTQSDEQQSRPHLNTDQLHSFHRRTSITRIEKETLSYTLYVPY